MPGVFLAKNDIFHPFFESYKSVLFGKFWRPMPVRPFRYLKKIRYQNFEFVHPKQLIYHEKVPGYSTKNFYSFYKFHINFFKFFKINVGTLNRGVENKNKNHMNHIKSCIIWEQKLKGDKNFFGSFWYLHK